MIKTLKIISLTLVCSFCATINQAQSTSLDEMYRDLVRSNNAGYLPTYIKNRNAPEFLIDHEQLIKAQKNKDIYPEDAEDVEVNFDDKRLVRERIEKAKILLWQQTLQAVKDNRVTPVELKEIKDRVAEDDPEATEIYAYMYAKGIGVNLDLNQAFRLYRKAEKLNVPQAKENAAKIYKVMTPQQREQLYQEKGTLN